MTNDGSYGKNKSFFFLFLFSDVVTEEKLSNAKIAEVKEFFNEQYVNERKKIENFNPTKEQNHWNNVEKEKKFSKIC